VLTTIGRKPRLSPPVAPIVTGGLEARLIAPACSAPPPGLPTLVAATAGAPRRPGRSSSGSNPCTAGAASTPDRAEPRSTGRSAADEDQRLWAKSCTWRLSPNLRWMSGAPVQPCGTDGPLIPPCAPSLPGLSRTNGPPIPPRWTDGPSIRSGHVRRIRQQPPCEALAPQTSITLARDSTISATVQVSRPTGSCQVQRSRSQPARVIAVPMRPVDAEPGEIGARHRVCAATNQGVRLATHGRRPIRVGTSRRPGRPRRYNERGDSVVVRGCAMHIRLVRARREITLRAVRSSTNSSGCHLERDVASLRGSAPAARK
jgi:hypothetical protein